MYKIEGNEYESNENSEIYQSQTTNDEGKSHVNCDAI